MRGLTLSPAHIESKTHTLERAEWADIFPEVEEPESCKLAQLYHASLGGHLAPPLEP